MTTVTVEMLYKSFGVLADAKDKASEHVDCYETILKGVQGNQSAKRLSAQFISRFFRYFKDKSEDSLNAIMDLCEDDDSSIRRAAIKEIPNICKYDPLQIQRLADVLVQLTQTDDNSELSSVNIALVALFELDARDTLKGLFSQIQQGEDVIRERAIGFLCNKLKTFSESVMTKDVEEYVLTETKKIMEDVTGDEFQQLIKVISSLSHLQTFQGRQQILTIIIEKITDDEFSASDEDSVSKIIQCMKIAQPLYSKNVHSSLFVKYVCENIVPKLKDIQVEEEKKEDRRLEIIKFLAEMSPFIGDGSKVISSIEPLYKVLIEYMPLPPEGDDENSTTPGDPTLNFSYVECLLYAFYQLTSKNPDFLTNEEVEERLKDFRKRLQYFARGLALYIKQLRMALQGKTREQLKSEPQSKLKVVALKTCNNINTLVKDLFHNPPSYKSSINLSWKPATTEADPKQAQKRPASTPSATNGDQKRTGKGERQLYRTPGGKYSSGMDGGRGRDGGGFRRRGGGSGRRYR
ncbi:apoptosis inhibitor 5-like [Styela clava]